MEVDTSLTIDKVRILIEEKLDNKYKRDEYAIIKIQGENEEEILDDEKTIAEIFGNDVKEPTLFVAIRTLAGVKIKVTNKTSEKIPLIYGNTKRWQDIELPCDFNTPIEVAKDHWWRKNTKGKIIVKGVKRSTFKFQLYLIIIVEVTV